jgi:hypothetical protein
MIIRIFERDWMSSSGVGPGDRDPYRIEEIERVQWEEKRNKEREGAPREPPNAAHPGLLGFLFIFLEKVIGLALRSIRKGMEIAALEPARENLLLIKAAFETMKHEDRSQDAQFLKRLSHLWQAALEHNIELQAKNPKAQQFKAFIKDIENFPENEGHTFGYYLNEYAGQKWLPFPYMELIQRLHHEFEMDPESSLLSRWTRMIDEILQG